MKTEYEFSNITLRVRGVIKSPKKLNLKVRVPTILFRTRVGSNFNSSALISNTSRINKKALLKMIINVSRNSDHRFVNEISVSGLAGKTV
jgi:hypothetical protein